MRKELKRWVVPVELIVEGEDVHDAADYAVAALQYLLDSDQDGIVAFDDDIDVDLIEEQNLDE